MFIVPITSKIMPIDPLQKAVAAPPATEVRKTEDGPTFLDAMKALWENAADAQATRNEDMINLMLGDTDSLEQVQINIAKAQVATELLVNVKNAAVDAYNEIMRMSI